MCILMFVTATTCITGGDSAGGGAKQWGRLARGKWASAGVIGWAGKVAGWCGDDRTSMGPSGKQTRG